MKRQSSIKFVRLRGALFVVLLFGLSVFFSGCGGGGGGSPKSTSFSISGTVSGDVKQGVTITLSGASSTTATTDASGNYTFSSIANGAYTVTPSITGYTFIPANKAVTVNSANSASNDFTAAASSGTTYSISGTITKSGGGALSSVTITLSGAGSGTATTDASGNYIFSSLANGSYTLTPSLSGYTFSPASSAQTVSGANISSVDFTASVTQAAQWPMYGYDRQHTGRCPYIGTKSFTQKWKFTLPGSQGFSYNTPTISADGTIYVGSNNHNFYAIDGATGAQKWVFSTSVAISGVPCIGTDGTVYFEGYNNLYALDGATGKQKWYVNIGVPLSDPVIGTDGTIYLIGYSKLYALDGATGAQKWVLQVNIYSPFCTPTIGSDGTIYVAGNPDNGDYKFYALDGATGQTKWEVNTPHGVENSPTIGVDGTVYIMSSASGSMYIFALDGSTGAQKWQYEIQDSMWYTGLAIGADGTLFVPGNAGFYALESATGKLKWQYLPSSHQDLLGLQRPPIIDASGRVYLSGSFSFVVFDGTTGVLLRRDNTIISTSSPVIGTDGTVYVCDGSGLYAFGE